MIVGKQAEDQNSFAGTLFHGTWSTEFSAQFFPDLSRDKSMGTFRTLTHF